MNTTSRKAAAGFFAAAALGLAACSPPHQIDSDQKIDTALSQNPDSLPSASATMTSTTTSATPTTSSSTPTSSISETSTSNNSEVRPIFVNCGEDVGSEPKQISLNCAEGNDTLEDIKWDEWNEAGATGVGTRVTAEPDRREENIRVLLENPVEIDGDLQFTAVAVDGVELNLQG